jgi:hypothetical protein
MARHYTEPLPVHCRAQPSPQHGMSWELNRNEVYLTHTKWELGTYLHLITS